MKTFKTRFNCGDNVNVRCDEAGEPPFYPAVICEVSVGKDCKDHYTVTTNGKDRTDGYTEDWLSPRLELQPTSEAAVDEYNATRNQKEKE